MTSTVLFYEKDKKHSILQEVIERSGQNIHSCYQCRRCAAGCPVGDDTGITPDRLIRLLIMEDREAAFQNELVWRCVSCYTCGTRCPNEIQTARITETLKKMAKEAHLEPLKPRVKAFHDAFCTAARHFGRVNEMEFMGLYEMKNAINDLSQKNIKGVVDELKAQAQMGMAMKQRKRLHFKLERVKDRDELKRLFKRAGDRKTDSKTTA